MRARPRHLVAALLGLAVLAALGLSGVVPGLGPSTLLGDPGAAPRTSATTVGPATPSASGTTPSGPLTLVGLGDSVPSAETCGCTGYVEQVGQRLGALTHRSWVVHNDANGGWTTSDVEDDLGSSSTRGHLANADLVLVEVGANDFDLDRVDDQGCFPAAGSDCWSATIAGLRDGLTRIIAAIHRVDHRPDLRIALLGYWNVTVDGSVGRALGEDFVLGSDELTRLVNDTVHQVAATTGAVYVDAYSPLKGTSGTRDPTGDLLDDGDHPNASGHTLLSTAVVGELATPTAVAAWHGAS
ncbi:SGNH/GDSL hydrolase family protein [Terrabacter sp. Ter38]|uniref:SGNH/GDSL hydrolase family protein n=1 Tax=Terrabacter sp. Ter38 TaxID=2926030 RepID=UPI0021197B10|nr:SGNH/GDSL hydrolase family protein [Terrabacter sp. Ter38]